MRTYVVGATLVVALTVTGCGSSPEGGVVVTTPTASSATESGAAAPPSGETVPGAVRGSPYGSLRAITAASSIVVVGTVTSSSGQVTVPNGPLKGAIATQAVMQVRTVLKGDAPNTITVNQYDPMVMPAAYGRESMRRRRTYLLFLLPDEAIKASNTYVVNSDGLYYLDRNVFRIGAENRDGLPTSIGSDDAAALIR